MNEALEQLLAGDSHTAKGQYMALRAMRTGLVLDQIAFYAPDERAADDVKMYFGLSDADWTEDHVTGNVRVFGEYEDEAESRARLLFNYDLGIELEILTYTDGPNWHAYRDNICFGSGLREGSPPFVSHLGFHVNDGELPILPWPIAQEMITTSHSNPAIHDRRYAYRIFSTRAMLGVDLKYIKRLA